MSANKIEVLSVATTSEKGERTVAILRIEHPVRDYDLWKQAFDSDPALRQKGGVRRYQVLRAVDDPNYVMIDLEFDTPDRAEAFLASLRVLWAGVTGRIISAPQARIAQAVETGEYD